MLQKQSWLCCFSPNPTGRAYSIPPNSYLDFRGHFMAGKGIRGERKRGVEVRERNLEGSDPHSVCDRLTLMFTLN